MVVTARQLCRWLHGIFAEPLTDAPLTHTCQRSSALPSSTPLAVFGRATNERDCSPPPTTSQRHQCAPLAHAAFGARNHTHDNVERSTRLSSPPRKDSNFFWQAV